MPDSGVVDQRCEALGIITLRFQCPDTTNRKLNNQNRPMLVRFVDFIFETTDQ